MSTHKISSLPVIANPIQSGSVQGSGPLVVQSGNAPAPNDEAGGRVQDGFAESVGFAPAQLDPNAPGCSDLQTWSSFKDAIVNQVAEGRVHINPAVINPAIEDSGERRPVHINPAVINPAIEDSGEKKPVHINPAVINPAIEDSGERSPVHINPAVINPAIEGSGEKKPVHINPAVINPAIESPARDE